MTNTALKECLEAVACPTCGSKVIPTREKILFCQTCFVGYPMSGSIPDLRQANAINFRKSATEEKEGVIARFQVPNGKALKDSFELKRGHCVVLGRAARQDSESDITYFGVNETLIHLNNHTLQHIEKLLQQSNRNKATPTSFAGMPLPVAQALGGFTRDPDVFLDDRSVSRAHAVIYQDNEAVWVFDLVSKNGTYVNGREVEKARLKHNDMLSLGTVSLKVKLR